MKAKIIGIVIVTAVVVSVISAILFAGPVEVSTEPEDEFAHWNRSEHFGVNKYEYKIGENIFFIARDLSPYDVGSIAFVMPNGTTKYIVIPFDGSIKSGFNQYFKPSLSKARGICSTADLIGEWSVVFQGTRYEPLKFKIINETIPSEIAIFERVC